MSRMERMRQNLERDQEVHSVILYKYPQSVAYKSQKDEAVCFEK